MQTEPTEISPRERYLEAELDYVIANFTNISLPLRLTLRRVAAFGILALDENEQNLGQTSYGKMLDKLLYAVEVKWPEITPMQLVNFTEWYAAAVQQFSLSESDFIANLRGF